MRGDLYKQVKALLSTDVETVKTAVLSCGHSRRYDLRVSRIRKPYVDSLACPICTNARGKREEVSR